jgi:cell wall-associated NlpC family hydrolase
MIFILITLLSFALHAQTPQYRIVTTPVADLRYKPEQMPQNLTLPASDLANPLQATQLLLGEQIKVNDELIDEQNKAWLWINTLQQQYFDEQEGWRGYPGWIEKDQTKLVQNFIQPNLVVNTQLAPIFDKNGTTINTLSIGTRLYATALHGDWFTINAHSGTDAYIHKNNVYPIHNHVSESIDDLRMSIINTAKQFLGSWYSWGGRSAQNDAWSMSSVDCSALISLSFLAHGLQIPRMSHEQFLRSKKIGSCKELQPGDLIFFASITKKSTRMDHVMLYLGEDELLEATYAGEHKARIVSFQERMNNPCNGITYGESVGWNNEEFQVFFGTFFDEQSTVQKLRDDALKINYEKE